MNYLLLICSIITLFSTVKSSSNSDPKIWHNAKTCKLPNGADGRCLLFEKCPKGREAPDDPSCGTGQFPDVCCESKPEDFVEITYGRVAKQECNKFIDIHGWQNFGYIFGGTSARSKEFTFMAALGYGANVSDIKYECGGSLISERHVLTAAHCIFSPENGPVKYVLVGDLDILKTDDDAQPQHLLVQNFTIHPDYKRSSSYNDIAILHLNKPVNLTDYVHPACLDFGQLAIVPNKTKFYATGWGFIDTDNTRASHMQEVNLIEYDLETCRKVYPMNRRKLAVGLQESQMCAGGATEKKDTCQGDSGGPLSITNDDIRYEQYSGYIIVGVTSFGKLCGYTRAPGVYTRVQKYVPWIESVVWPEQVAALENTKNEAQNPNLNTNSNGQIQTEVQVVPATEINPGVFTEDADNVNKANVPLSTTKPINLIDIHYFSDKK